MTFKSQSNSCTKSVMLNSAKSSMIDTRKFCIKTSYEPQQAFPVS